VNKQMEISKTWTTACSMNAELICFPEKPLIAFSLYQLNIAQPFVENETK